eukprot:CAMPEP_0119568470 /NCGR_PEP_ID=MMETSP1352-20130426/38962_1 /TAXON_ID=265584 /ORGANISM="Stauroneis constricta, Strain CCMP1120" /LENGTH=124 /DNA_ID=CAMNT_0007617873 /DNA_START=73 /DNA_END=447 /DNA_ORIENTATION=+
MSSPAHTLASNGGSSGNANANNAGACENPGDSDIPLLPSSDPDPSIPTIKLGETIRFEELGPIILNTDGTTRRIGNWDTLSEHEKKVTWRRISKRNEERRQVLLRQQQQELEAAEEEGEGDETK